MSSALPAGTIIDGKYRVAGVLGAGAMGVVMAAEHLSLGSRVALKFLRIDDSAPKDASRARFRREAQICAKVKNEHITRVIDVGSHNDAEYMVMEHLQGQDLRAFMRGREPLSPEEAVDFGVQICDGLAAVHAHGIVHRDLKPSNLFVVRRTDGSPLIKILDFGISKWAADLDDDELTKTGTVLGSPKYMAPEQLFGSNRVDMRADVWSIGAILYELLSGRPPLDEPTFARIIARLASGLPPPRLREQREGISAELDAAVMLCLERNYDQRIPDVARLAGELLAAIGDPHADSVRLRYQAVVAGNDTQTSMASGEWIRAALAKTPAEGIARVAASTGSNATAMTVAAPERSRKGSTSCWQRSRCSPSWQLVFLTPRPHQPPQPRRCPSQC